MLAVVTAEIATSVGCLALSALNYPDREESCACSFLFDVFSHAMMLYSMGFMIYFHFNIQKQPALCVRKASTAR